jgi:hypothetical protein
VAFPLFLDEDVDVELASMLGAAGYDVLTTLSAGRANLALSDDDQLTYAAANGRALFSHNVRDFVALAQEWASSGRVHAGLILSSRYRTYVMKSMFEVLLEARSDVRNECLRLEDFRPN